MGDQHDPRVTNHAASTGQTMADATWLDTHFEACRPEYEGALRAVDLQRGWRVLDAGCGSGSFLPLIAAAIGPTGAIAALDFAPENVATVIQRVAEWAHTTPVVARQGSALALPYADDSFDAVWCANTSQYLTDDELATMLAEFRRVTRPGGLVALKEFDGTVPRFHPAPLNAFLHIFEAVGRRGLVQCLGTLRAPTLGAWLQRAGLLNVSTHTTLIERTAPLSATERSLWSDYFTYWAAFAPDYDLLATDQALWTRLTDPTERERLLDDPEFSCCEGFITATGTAP